MSTDPVLFLLKAALRLPGPQIDRLADGLITELGKLDGDPDLEPNGDDEPIDEREGVEHG